MRCDFLRHITCALLCAFITCHAFAETAANDLATKLAQIQTFQAHFTQTLYDENRSKLQTSTGVFYLKRPDRFRWAVNKPNRQIIVADGTSVWNYNPDLEQATRRPQNTALQNTPAEILSARAETYLANFTITESGKDYTLLPNHEGSNFSKILLTFSDGAVSKMVLFDKLGQETDVTFQKIRLNQPIGAKHLQIHLPKGTDVIQQK